MAENNTVWAIVDDVPTECVVLEDLAQIPKGGCVCIRPIDEPENPGFPILRSYVHERKEDAIKQALEVLREYYDNEEKDIQNRMAIHASLSDTIKSLEKELEKHDAEG